MQTQPTATHTQSPPPAGDLGGHPTQSSQLPDAHIPNVPQAGTSDLAIILSFVILAKILFHNR
ncbi:MAG: hypothetical protein AAGE92_12120 [Cyanobacteria bacterium P01_G01_bin.4]